MPLIALYALEAIAIAAAAAASAWLGWRLAGSSRLGATSIAACGTFAAALDPISLHAPILYSIPQPIPIAIDLVHATAGLLAGVAIRTTWHRPRGRILGAVLIVLGSFYLLKGPVSLLVVGPRFAALEARSSPGGHPLQSTPYTCAPTCSLALLEAAGVRATEGEMSRRCRTSVFGTTWARLAAAIEEAAAERGVEIDAVLRSGLAFEDLPHLPAPAILSVQTPEGQGHAVLYLGRSDFDSARIRIGDPLDPPIWDLSLEEFQLKYAWNGLALHLEPRR